MYTSEVFFNKDKECFVGLIYETVLGQRGVIKSYENSDEDTVIQWVDEWFFKREGKCVNCEH